MKPALFLVFAFVSFTQSAVAETWMVDASHSTIGFSIRHMMISNTRGQFNKFSGTLNLSEANPTKGSVTINIDTSSIDTRDPGRDKNLRGPDFFNTSKFKSMTFKSRSIKKVGSHYEVSGVLTIRKVIKSVVLIVSLSKPVATPFGTTVRGATVTGKISRKDFGMTWNKAIDTGGLVVGDEVKLDIDIELIKKP